MIGAHGYMGFQRVHRIDEGGAVLDFQPGDGVRVVAAPDLGLIVEHGRVIPPASSAAAAEDHLLMGKNHLIHDPVQSQHVPVKSLSLAFFWKKSGPDIGNAPVHIPLHILNFRIRKQFVDHGNQIITDIFSGKIQNQLISSSGHGTARRFQAPVWMAPVKIAVFRYHLRLNPDAEFQSHVMNLF